MVAPSHPVVESEPASYPAAGYAGSYPAAAHFQPAAPPVDTSAGDVVVGWTADVAAPRYYSRRRRGDYSLPVAIFITLLIVGGLAYYARKHWNQAVEVGTSVPAPRTGTTAPAPVVPFGNDTTRPPETIFNASKAAAGPTTAAAVIPLQPDPATTDPSSVPPVMQDPGTNVAAADPGGGDGTGQDAVDASSEAAGTSGATGADDSAWKQVQTARFSPDEAKAIVLFDDYARTHPGRNTADVQAYAEKAIDRIWFERIEQLFKQRDALKAKLTETERDLAAETDEAYKKRVLVPLKTEYDKRLKAVEAELTGGMKYAGAKDPNLLDEEELARLRKQRDPAVYAEWKEKVLAHIRRTHGELPWPKDQGG